MFRGRLLARRCRFALAQRSRFRGLTFCFGRFAFCSLFLAALGVLEGATFGLFLCAPLRFLPRPALCLQFLAQVFGFAARLLGGLVFLLEQRFSLLASRLVRRTTLGFRLFAREGFSRRPCFGLSFRTRFCFSTGEGFRIRPGFGLRLRFRFGLGARLGISLCLKFRFGSFPCGRLRFRLGRGERARTRLCLRPGFRLGFRPCSGFRVRFRLGRRLRLETLLDCRLERRIALDLGARLGLRLETRHFFTRLVIQRSGLLRLVGRITCERCNIHLRRPRCSRPRRYLHRLREIEIFARCRRRRKSTRRCRTCGRLAGRRRRRAPARQTNESVMFEFVDEALQPLLTKLFEAREDIA